MPGIGETHAICRGDGRVIRTRCSSRSSCSSRHRSSASCRGTENSSGGFRRSHPSPHRSRNFQVMEAWEGLGYYARARSLHQLARLTAPAPHRPGRAARIARHRRIYGRMRSRPLRTSGARGARRHECGARPDPRVRAGTRPENAPRAPSRMDDCRSHAPTLWHRGVLAEPGAHRAGCAHLHCTSGALRRLSGQHYLQKRRGRQGSAAACCQLGTSRPLPPRGTRQRPLIRPFRRSGIDLPGPRDLLLLVEEHLLPLRQPPRRPRDREQHREE